MNLSVIVYQIITFFTQIQYFILNLHDKYIKTKSVFEISSVKDLKTSQDITDAYTNNIQLTDKFIIDWKLDNTMYKNIYDNNTIKYFPPYNFFDMRNHKNEHKIIAALLACDGKIVKKLFEIPVVLLKYYHQEH